MVGSALVCLIPLSSAAFHIFFDGPFQMFEHSLVLVVRECDAIIIVNRSVQGLFSNVLQMMGGVKDQRQSVVFTAKLSFRVGISLFV